MNSLYLLGTLAGVVPNGKFVVSTRVAQQTHTHIELECMEIDYAIVYRKQMRYEKVKMTMRTPEERLGAMVEVDTHAFELEQT